MKRNNTQESTVRIELGQWELTINENELERLATMANHSFRDGDIDEAVAWIIRAWSYMEEDPVVSDDPAFSDDHVMDILSSLVAARDDHRFLTTLRIDRKEADDVR